MRVKFNITLAVEIKEKDKEVKEAFKEIVRTHAQELYSQSTMMSRRAVDIHVSSEDDEDGIVDMRIF